MVSNSQLVDLFFTELHSYNTSNFKALETADLSIQDAAVYKAFSSVITRYFIFKEKHPEIPESMLNFLYYRLKLDLVAVYFSEYPDTTTDYLVAFQLELKRYLKNHKSNSNIEEEGVNEERPAV